VNGNMRLRYFYDRRTSPAAAKGTGGEEEGSALFLSKAKAGLDTCLLHPKGEGTFLVSSASPSGVHSSQS